MQLDKMVKSAIGEVGQRKTPARGDRGQVKGTYESANPPIQAECSASVNRRQSRGRLKCVSVVTPPYPGRTHRNCRNLRNEFRIRLSLSGRTAPIS